ncbi:MAG: outer membrane lipoprotein-sorting protein, partial [Aureispira sp.]
PVVWGKVIIWIDTKDYLNLKTEHYDEDDDLVDTSYGQNIKELGGRLLPTKMVLVPADEEGHKTIMEYTSLEFDTKFEDLFFSTQNMKRVR